MIGYTYFDPKAGLGLNALELSPRIGIEDAKKKFPQCSDYPLITFSDAHSLNDIGRSTTTFLMEEVSVKEMKLALLGRGGRRVFL